MKVLVTGANGFVALHLIQQLLERGYEVVGTVRNLSRAPKIFEKVSYKEADLSSPDGWLGAMEGIEAVFHVASPLGGENPNDPALVQEAVAGVSHVFEAVHQAGIKRVILTSSQAAATPLAKETGVISDDFWSDPANPELNAYRLSKLEAEKEGWLLAEKYGIDLTAILPGAVFGPSLTENRSTSQVLDQIHAAPFVPNITLEVTDVRDLATLHILALENSESIGKRYIAKNDDLTFAQISRLYGKTPVVLPDFFLRGLAKFQKPLRALVPMLGRKYTHSNERARELGWEPRDASETVKDAIK
ncbi:MAG: NAD-dependent epimerase/dehydratase family protein [Turicibacter sp.]|nr:NAD-dependent epimerase/dehydratase family protein [Turicibacter sp.]